MRALYVIAVSLALCSYSLRVASSPEREIILDAQSQAEARLRNGRWRIAEDVRVPGAPSTYSLPLPQEYQQPGVPDYQQQPTPRAPSWTPPQTRSETSSFHATTPQPLEKVTNLECVIERATSVETRDPIYKISVKLTLDDNLNVEDLSVIHHARSGASYNRADQYTGAQLSQVPGHIDYTWTGTLAKSPSKSMKGRLVRTTDMRWAYLEQLSDGGRSDYSMESVCHVEGDSLKIEQMPMTPQAMQYYYVWDTRPPDNWLSLRAEPSDRAGGKIAELPNGTLLEVIEQRPDNWWRVRPVGWEVEGWVLSKQGNRIWVYCCRSH